MVYAGQDQTQRTQAATTSYVNSALGVASATSSGSTDSYTRDSRGTLVSLRAASGSRYYYLFDGLGSVVGLVNSSGAKVNSYSYDPYGMQTSASETVANPWRYAGGLLDSQTGLTKFGTRYYDPDLGRFTQRDPSGQDLPYAYAAGNPINNTDPSGLFGLSTVFGVVAGAFAGAATDLIVTPFLTISLGILAPPLAPLAIPIGGCVAGLAGTFVATGGSPDTSGDIYAGACIGGAATNVALVVLPLLAAA